jgi:hypothetical protein
VKQMRRYAEARATSSRRFCREHRMELIQADIKYGPDIRTALHSFYLEKISRKYAKKLRVPLVFAKQKAIDM